MTVYAALHQLVEPVFSIANDIAEGWELAGEHHWTGHDALPTVEHHPLPVVEIIVGVGVTQ